MPAMRTPCWCTIPTDYVFDGEKHGSYIESDITSPQSAYGRTKCAGEAAISDSGCQALIFRTSWVFSAHGGNFIKTIMRLAKERDNLGIVADQIGTPTSAELISDVTALAIAAHKKSAISTRRVSPDRWRRHQLARLGYPCGG